MSLLQQTQKHQKNLLFTNRYKIKSNHFGKIVTTNKSKKLLMNYNTLTLIIDSSFNKKQIKEKLSKLLDFKIIKLNTLLKLVLDILVLKDLKKLI
mmetsp:Transcript_7599/g.10770  ORF Transcript_7599/g.10770 Transcript_7599/m.10770 type:complete len:95 (+) Transcript_7599:2455-2739(+)